MPTSPPSVAAVLALLSRDPGRPRLTWYGPEGERIELSGHVLDNWVTKTANLLVEELGAGPRTRVVLDLPPHWRSLVWSLAVWRVGAHLVLDPAAEAQVVVTDRPDQHREPSSGARGPDLVAVALPALARRFDGDLPAGALDAASAVMTYGDVLGLVPETEPAAPALTAAGGPDAPVETVPYRDLVDWAGRTARLPRAASPGTGSPAAADAPHDGPGRARALLDADLGTAAVLATALTLWADDGSVVLCSPEVAAGLAADPERRRRLVENERITREG